MKLHPIHIVRLALVAGITAYAGLAIYNELTMEEPVKPKSKVDIILEEYDTNYRDEKLDRVELSNLLKDCLVVKKGE